MNGRNTATVWLQFDGEPLIDWRRKDSNWPRETVNFAKSTEYQVCFVGDTLPKAYCANADEYRYANGGAGVMVIGSHRSKSIDLPVYGVDIPSLGVRAVISDNFHQWTVSVELPRPVDLSQFKDVMSMDRQDPSYCYGFEGRWVYPSPEESPTIWTTRMSSTYDIYAVFMSIAHQLRTGKVTSSDSQKITEAVIELSRDNLKGMK